MLHLTGRNVAASAECTRRSQLTRDVVAAGGVAFAGWRSTTVALLPSLNEAVPALGRVVEHGRWHVLQTLGERHGQQGTQVLHRARGPLLRRHGETASRSQQADDSLT